MTATPTTVDLDTELSAVNSILGAIGQSPVTTLNYENPEVGFIYDILTEVNKDVQVYSQKLERYKAELNTVGK